MPPFLERTANEFVKKGHNVWVSGVQRGKLSNTSRFRTIIRPKGKWKILIEILKWWAPVSVKKPGQALRLLQLLKGFEGKEKWKEFLRIAPWYIQNPNVFHVQWAGSVEKIAYIFHQLPAPMVISLRGSHIHYGTLQNPKLQELLPLSFQYAACIHAVSEYMAKQAINMGAPAEKVKVIYPGVDDSWLEMPLPARNVQAKFIAITRYHWIKGVPMLIESFGKYKARGGKGQLTLIAPGRMPEEIKFSIYQLKLGNDIEIIQNVEHAHIPSVIQAHDILLVNSYAEGMSNVMLEAMALGVPVISTAWSGVEEAIQHEHHGYIVPCGESGEFAAAITRMENLNEPDRMAMIMAAREKIKSKFLFSTQTQQWISLYEHIGK